MTRSALVVVVAIALLLGLQLLAESNAAALTNVPWALSLTLMGLLLALFGGLTYRFLSGGVLVKLVLIVLAVAAANGIAQFLVGSDQAYPNLRLWLIIPYALACCAGAGIGMLIARSSRGRAVH